MIDQKQAGYVYELVYTEDGSPSVRMGSALQIPEMMHHSGGALTESLYIYLAAVRRSVELGFAPRVLSVGLGIGYNEALAAAHLLSAGRADEMHLASFEIDDLLRESYVEWLMSPQALSATTLKAMASQCPTVITERADFAPIFGEVVIQIAAKLDLEPIKIHATLARAFREGRFKLYEALEKRPALEQQYSCILFDAFSKKATPDLWHEEFLVKFLADACAPGCVLATYAATGNLNRALRGAGFNLIPRTGFQGKRESTWAERAPR